MYSVHCTGYNCIWNNMFRSNILKECIVKIVLRPITNFHENNATENKCLCAQLLSG